MTTTIELDRYNIRLLELHDIYEVTNAAFDVLCIGEFLVNNRHSENAGFDDKEGAIL